MAEIEITSEPGSRMAAFAERLQWSNNGLVLKFAALFILAGLLVATASFALLERILDPTFASIESRVKTEQQARARHALDRFNEDLRQVALDYSNWNDLYAFARTGNSAFPAEMFNETGFDNLGIEGLAVIRFDGKRMWTGVTDPTDRKIDADDPGGLIEQIVGGKIHREIPRNKAIHAYIRGHHGVYSVQAVWIRKSDETGEPFAYLVMVRLLRKAELSKALQESVDLNLAPSARTRSALAATADHSVSRVDTDRIHTQIGLLGQNGDIIATVEYDMSRDIIAVGRGAIQSSIKVMGLGLMTLVIALALGINRIAVMRLAELRTFVREYGKSRAQIAPRLIASGDEIGSLARQFDQLGNELRNAESELRKQSYVQGKADSAVGLLHNVRNALGPLQVKYDKWLAEETKPYRGQLRQALDELSQGVDDLQRKTALENFVGAATRRLLEQGDERGSEIAEIRASIDMILAILSEYDFDSSGSVRTEVFDPRDDITREIREAEEAERVTISIDMPERLPEVSANRLHLTQIVGNLVRNAVDSMKANNAAPMCLTIKGRIVDGHAELLFTDNGEGAGPEALARCFERGFSTRLHKQGGMGLHWSANAARAMGGSLALESPGPGQGATARLRLKAAATDSQVDSLLARAA